MELVLETTEVDDVEVADTADEVVEVWVGKGSLKMEESVPQKSCGEGK